MELGHEIIEDREPVVFDITTLPEGFNKGTIDEIHAAFVFDRVAFDDDLHTAVARQHGINEQGELDVRMLAATEHVADYLRDKQDQPMILVDTAFEENSERDFVFMHGYIATVDSVDEPVGMVRGSRDNRKQSGIAVTEGFTRLHGYCDQNGSYRSQYLTDQDGSTAVPLSSREIVIGWPGKDSQREELSFRQEIVAGQDIVPWIETTFSEDNRYTFYMDVVQSIVRHRNSSKDLSVLDCLLVEPYVTLAKRERDTLKDIEQTLKGYDSKVNNLRKMIDGAVAEANLTLGELDSQYRDIKGVVPQSSGSYPLPITSPLDSPYGSQLKERQYAIDWYQNTLGPLTLRAAQKEV